MSYGAKKQCNFMSDKVILKRQYPNPNVVNVESLMLISNDYSKIILIYFMNSWEQRVITSCPCNLKKSKSTSIVYLMSFRWNFSSKIYLI